jgi:hypothetical protein
VSGGYLREGAGVGGVDLAKAAIRKAKPAPRSETRRGCCRCALPPSSESQGRLADLFRRLARTVVQLPYYTILHCLGGLTLASLRPANISRVLMCMQIWLALTQPTSQYILHNAGEREAHIETLILIHKELHSMHDIRRTIVTYTLQYGRVSHPTTATRSAIDQHNISDKTEWPLINQNFLLADKSTSNRTDILSKDG